jgi:hypothetical protein
MSLVKREFISMLISVVMHILTSFQIQSSTSSQGILAVCYLHRQPKRQKSGKGVPGRRL